MKKLHIKKFKEISTKFFIFSLIILGTISLIYYARGYRINLEDQSIVKTGVLSIETQPSRAHFYLTDDIKGRTSRSVSSIPEGSYSLSIWLDGYHDLKYNIDIIAEKSTPISAMLFKKDPESNIVGNLESEVIDTKINKKDFFLLKETLEDSIQYNIFKYQTNLRFWELSNNLNNVFSFSSSLDSDVKSINISPNNNFAILEIDNGQILDENYLETGTHIISFETESSLTSLDNSDVKWSKDGLSIVWEDEEGIYKLNMEELDDIRTIYSKTEEQNILFFDVDYDSNLYILYQVEENDFATLSQIDKDGTETFLLEKIYYQTEERFLNASREKDFLNYQDFKSSPQSTLFVGQPNEFILSLDTKSVLLITDSSFYLYDISNNRYVLINPYESEFLSFSNDKKKLSFLDKENNRLGVFIFDREIGNYSINLGTYYNEDIEINNCSDFNWHNNSENIYIVCDNSLFVTDVRGFNNISLIENFGDFILIENNRKVTTLLNKKDFVEFDIN